MRTLRRYLWSEIVVATVFVLFALLSLFMFFDMVQQLDEIGRRGFQLHHAFSYVALTLPSRTYELMPIAALASSECASRSASEMLMRPAATASRTARSEGVGRVGSCSGTVLI